MGSKILWSGLTLIQCASLLPIPSVLVVGQVIMVIGLIMFLLDR
jgi:hypothetical protein